MGLHLNKVAKLVKLYNGVKGLNQPFFDTKTVEITGLWVKVENFIFEGSVSTFKNRKGSSKTGKDALKQENVLFFNLKRKKNLAETFYCVIFESLFLQ